MLFEKSAEDQTGVTAEVNAMPEYGENEMLVGEEPSTPMKLSIPEEDAVVMADTSYHPDKSPDREEAPSMSFSFEEADTSLSAPSSLEDTQKDLDAQIQELQTELDKCRSKDANHVTTTLPNGKGSLGNEMGESLVSVTPNNVENHTHHKEELHEDQNKSVEDHPCSGPVSSKSRKKGVLKGILVSVIISVCLLLILSILVLESDVDVPVLNDVRNLPDVRHFKKNQYEPLKISVTKTVQGWLKA